MQKVFNILSVISLLLTSSVIGGGVYSYLWLKNTDNQNMIKERLMKEVKKAIPLPSLSGPALPTGTLTPKQQKIEIKKSKGVPVMPITHNKPFPSCRCINEEKQVFGDSFKQVF